MSGNKAALKAAKAAIDAEKWDEAIVQAQIVLASDSQNYFAKLFLGRAFDKQGKVDDAAKAYQSATKIKPNDTQAWQGLCGLFEAQGSKMVDEYRDAALHLATIYAETDDKDRCQTVIDKLTSFTKEHGTRAQQKRTLEVLLPSSPVYDCLEGRILRPALTYTRIAEITEAEEKERINKEIGERRTRLGARIGQVTTDVKREVLSSSPLEGLYQNIIDWSNDDEARREYEEKLLQRVYDTLVVLSDDKKAAKREQVKKLAHDMVIIKHPFALAWDLDIEWKDAETMEEYDVGVLREYIDFFPGKGLSKILKGFLDCELSPFPAKQKQGTEDENDEPPLTSEDRLLLMTDGFDDSKRSTLAHRLMGDYYLSLEEFETAVDTTRKGLRVLATESHQSGLTFQNSLDALNSTLAASLVHYQTPKNHPEAKSLFDAILQRKPNFTPALIGVGLVLEEQEEYSQAVNFLSRALDRDPSNIRIGTEAAWCKSLGGDPARGLEELERYLPQIKTEDPRSRDLRAQTLYRIGMCLWELAPTKAARKDRNGAYARFLSSVRTNVNFAPAYTSLGIYYADYGRDKKRARQCFQKAFELSASETEAAERLTRAFADQGEWDIVEVIAQRVVDTGKVRPAPGSKKKGISWPFSALGVVQMNKQEYSKSIVSFLSALRISPDDYNSYVGLGESYHNSGRYNSARRTFRYAENPDDDTLMKKPEEAWFTKYMIANVDRELGDFDEAIEGYQRVFQERQTLVERAWRCIDTGFFGKAVQSATEAITIAATIARDRSNAFSLWKALGDACSVFSSVQSLIVDFPVDQVKELLLLDIDQEVYELFAEFDSIGRAQLEELPTTVANFTPTTLHHCLETAVLAHKRAIHACSSDIHAQAVAWFNLGWTEYRAYSCVGSTKEQQSRRFQKSAVRRFKRAIELEAGNADFWNALGVVTSELNPKVAQHSFVRSLYLNERNVTAWTNLGTLYLLQGDYELAHTAFGRAQSTDPDYAHAWLGEGLVALLWGDTKEALSHFTHAFEIADSSSLITKRQYAQSIFDHLVSSTSASDTITSLVQPLFALQQLQVQVTSDMPYHHLAALFLERVGNHDAAIKVLLSLCDAAEAEYEASESASALARYARAKADLARNQLAADAYSSATENAETALDLSSDMEASGLDFAAHRKLRLSAHLTAGLANYYQGATDPAIQMFRTALDESNNAADVVCLLAQVLWAKGGQVEKGVARDQLFNCVETHPSHVGAVLLLGVIAALDGDVDTMDAVREDLQTLRTTAELTVKEQNRVETVLAAIAAVSSTSGSDNSDTNNAIQTAIMLRPSRPYGWSELATMTGDAHPAEMTLRLAVAAAPPRGPLDTQDLAKAFVGTGRIGDAQRGIMLAPWVGRGWEALGDACA
ncbi:hypothetical protein LTR04_006266 [Oleoguttula sp. CCFEE 6159]|nr:hypothetical protein LTR04_006266 [Oleoguttula sp. CCFEE 6159]